MNMIFFLGTCLSIGIGFYMFINSLTQDIKNEMIAFSDRIEAEPNPILLTKQLDKLIEFHSTGKKCVQNKI